MRPIHATQTAAVVVLVALPILLGACRSVVSVPEFVPATPTQAGPLQQRVVIIVHGDASYLYHDGDGTPHQADEETLREAFAAARRMPQAEIFLFHLRPKTSILGLIPRDDGTFYHFRQGKLVRQTTYDQNRSDPLAAEADLLRDHRAPEADSSLFTAALYYGHAVPERARPGYHRSRPEIPFGIHPLADGLGRMTTADDTSFDAVVLSTCDGGTPSTLAALATHARSVLAAPDDLHLSFVDADLLATLPSTTDPERWTPLLADRAFDRLVGRVNTAVTLASYDVDSVAASARRMAQRVPPDTSTTPTGARHVDCRRVLDTDVDTSGLRVWHRSAQFGPRADHSSHSGWGCVPAASP